MGAISPRLAALTAAAMALPGVHARAADVPGEHPWGVDATHLEASDVPAHGDRIRALAVDGAAEDFDRSLDASAGDGLVHSIQTAEKGRLAASGWTDDGSDSLLGNRSGDIADCRGVAEESRQVSGDYTRFGVL